MPVFENVVAFAPPDRRGFFDCTFWIRSQMDRALSWDVLVQVRRRWKRKLIVKGLLDVADIVRAAEEGADAVAISNHGGRQLDWAAAPLDLLPAARDAVGNRIALIVDGGMRRGSDVLKAVALGADAVFAGRAPLYGVAAAGRAGAARALDILRAEIERGLGLIGAPSLAALDRSRLIRPWPGPSLFPARGGEACADPDGQRAFAKQRLGDQGGDPRERAERAERAGTSQERHPFAGIEHLGRQAQWRLGGHMPPSAISNETWFGLLRSERCRHRAAATACRLGSSGARRRDGPARCGRRVRRRCVYAPAPSPARCRPQRQ